MNDNLRFRRGMLGGCAALAVAAGLPVSGQVTTAGFSNGARAEAPGTLLSAPAANGSITLGRTTTLNYVNGWLIAGAESPGSAPGSDLSVRVYDISDPVNPVRRHPSDFNLNYPNNRWYVGNSGWNAHGSAQSGPLLLPMPVLRVAGFGGPVELGGTNNIANLGELPLGYNRSSQAGPWDATMLWYGTADQPMGINRVTLSQAGSASFQPLASFDHVGVFGGGDWHPLFFGDLLIYARSGGGASDGVVVYRLEYHNFDDPQNRSVTPHLVGSLAGGFDGYWPTLFSDGTGLYVIGSATDSLSAVDVTAAATPGSQQDPVRLAAGLTLPGFSNASYPVFQDQFGFIHNRKVDMTRFLAGDADPVVLTLVEGAPNHVDTSQMALVLGNLWVTGGYPGSDRAQGMGVWVHQQEPDTVAPRISYHVPQAGRTNYPRHAPLSFLLHEHPRHGGMRNGVDFMVRPVLGENQLGTPVAGFLIHDFSGVVTFTPEVGLAAETTYQVDFLSAAQDAVGFADAAGNFIEAYGFRFSTGGGLVAENPALDLATLVADTYQPGPGEPVTVTAGVSGAGPVEYRFNFAGSWSAWSTTPSATHTYHSTGRRRVLAQVRDLDASLRTLPLNLLVIEAPAGPQPTQSSSMAVGEDPAGRRLWTVNPDANTVSVLDAAGGQKLAEYPVGRDPRCIARDAQGRYWVSCHGSDELRVLNPDGTTAASVALAYGSAPFGVAASPDGAWMFVTLYGSAQLLRFNAGSPDAPPSMRETFPTPRAIAVSADAQRVFVTRFISPDLEGQVAEFAGLAAELPQTRLISLASANSTDRGDRAAGVPNYLASIAISPDGSRAAVVSKQDNIQRGTLFGVGDLSFESSVRAVVSFIDLTTNSELRHTRRDFDNSEGPTAVAFTPLGETLLVSLQGSNRVVGVDALNVAAAVGPDTPGSTLSSPAVVSLELATGLAPQGLVVDAVSQRVFVGNFMGRSVSVFDASLLLGENRPSLPLVASTATVGSEPLEPAVLLGKRIFYNAADVRMSADGYLSCASCHVDGGHDGRVWDFSGRGEGLRRTPDLRGRAGMGHGNVHWSGNFDEIQDFEHDIRGGFGGAGFLEATPEEFAAQHPDPGSVKAGLSEELDALDAYLSTLGAAAVPRSAQRSFHGALTDAAQRGRAVFAAQNCAACHGGMNFSASQTSPVGTPALVDVGTLTGVSGQRLGGPLEGIDPPTLRGLHGSRRFLHHGGAENLAGVFDYTGGVLLLAAQGELLNLGAGAVESDTPGEGGGGFMRGLLGGTLVNIAGSPGSGVRFNNIDGGANGGPARLALRYVRQYSNSTAVVRVNGVEQVLNLLRQSPDNSWQVSGWRWAIGEVMLEPGATNQVEVVRSNNEYSDFLLNAVVVSNSDVRAAAAPHRLVQSLPSGERADLLAYLSQLDGSDDEVAPGSPGVLIEARQSSPSDSPLVEFDVVFSEPVSGFGASDVELGGSAGFSASSLTTVTAGRHYRMRVAGFLQAGSVTLEVPAGSALAVAGGAPNSAAAASWTYTGSDELAGQSDEFDDPARLATWQRLSVTEGWGAEKLETWDIDGSRSGHMRLMPYASTWYQDRAGALVFREVTGDFVATMKMEARRRNGQPGPPSSAYSLGGIMVRTPRNFSNAAPVPDPGAAVVLPWPPPPFGQPNHYSTPWQPGGENYLFLSFGNADGVWGNLPNTWQCEVKTTTNSVSTLYATQAGIPANSDLVTLQIIRRGPLFLLLRRHAEGGPWIVENRFVRNDLPATVQVGITTYSDWSTVAGQNEFHHNRTVTHGGNPDLVVDADYFRLRRPAPALTGELLAAVPVTGHGGAPVLLDSTALAGMLGSAADVAANGQSYGAWLAERFSPAELVDAHVSDPLSDPDGNGHGNLLDYLTGGGAAGALKLVVDDGVARVTLGRNPAARGYRLVIEGSGDLAGWELLGEVENGAAPTGPGVISEAAGPPRVMTIQDSGLGGLQRYFRVRAEVLGGG